MYSQLFSLHAELLKAIAHPDRLEIIQLLREQELCVSDIYSMLNFPQAKISQHLMILRNANVVTARKQGKQIFYSIAHPVIIQSSDLIRKMLIDQHKNTELADELTLRMTDLVPIVLDPVCQMRLSPKTASFMAQFKGHDYFFCASGCHTKFTTHPEAYVH